MDTSGVRPGDIVEVDGMRVAHVVKKYVRDGTQLYDVAYVDNPLANWPIRYTQITRHWKLQGRRRGRPARSEGMTVEPERAAPRGIDKSNPFMVR